eukprot:503371_1
MTAMVLSIILILSFNFSLYLSKSTLPPRGWNSWICYRGCVNESQFLQNAEAVAKYLKPFGYEYVVTDGGWSGEVDGYGRPQPNITKYPHSANGTGFKWLSSQIHSMGLKFGIWVGRGITQNAINKNSPIYGTDNKIHATDIYNKSEQCPWAHELFGVDFTKNGSQQFINSLYTQFAEWGVDFIKNDCVFGPNYVPKQIELVSNAMNNIYKTMNEYEFTYSLSAGNYAPPSTLPNVQNVTGVSNMYRITGDTWDQWNTILQHFNVTAEWAANNFVGGMGRDGGLSYPDLDMMPLGFITDRTGSRCQPYRWTGLTQSQQRVLFTLWSICKSPLIFGGEVTQLENDTFTRNLITNKYALSVNFNSTGNKQISGVYENGYPTEIIWSANGLNNDYYVAFFNVNINKYNNTANMIISFDSISGNIGKYKQCEYIEAWTGNSGTMSNSVVQGIVNANDAALFYLHSCS